MAFEVKIPEIGESINEGFLAEWSQSDGAVVAEEDQLLVLETDKVTMNVTAEVGGKLEILVPEGEEVEVGQVVARIDTDAAGEAETQAADDSEADDREAADDADEPTEDEERERDEETKETKETKKKPAADSGADQRDALTPAVRRLVSEHDLDPDEIEGSGKDGRILKGDVLAFIEGRGPDDEGPTDAQKRRAQKPEPKPLPSRPKTTAVGDFGERQTREPMSRLRRRLAERLVQVQQEAAILTTFNEVDMSRVMALRSTYKDSFNERHGVGLGFMSFFVKAAVDALKTVPEVNAYIDGGDIVTNHYYDIGIAVSSDRGLVVPVVRDADRLSMAEIESSIAELAGKARDRSLELSDLQGAVFTISNGGIFGSMLSTPILNPPGSAILGMHAIEKRAVVVDDEIVIRPVMYLALSYDHRIIDGREAVTFLKRIVDTLENPERMMLEV